MRLSKEQYQRGLLFWKSKQPVKFSTRTSNNPDAGGDWSEELTNPHGSLVTSDPLRYCDLKANLEFGKPLEVPFQVRWEQLRDNSVITHVFDDTLTGKPTTLMHLPNYGVFHRLVVATPYLRWSNDSAIRNGDVIIRLITGAITGEKVEPIDRVETNDGLPAITGSPSGTQEITGQFIEIVASGHTPLEAEAVAHSILGLLGLIIGPHVVGEVVFSEPYASSPNKQLGTLHIPVIAHFPKDAEDSEMELIDALIPKLAEQDRKTRAQRLALRWYERGIRSADPLDQLLAFFIGMETVISAEAEVNKPILPVAKREKHLQEVLKSLSKASHRDFLKQRTDQIVGASLTDRFRFYSEKADWPAEDIMLFATLAKARSEAVHGELVSYDKELSRKAESLLVKLLKRELGVTFAFGWETLPRVRSMSLEYELLLNGPQSAT